MRENKNGLNNLIKNNIFFVKSGICIVLLLLLCYLGINSPVKTTYSAMVSGNCPIDYARFDGSPIYDKIIDQDIVGEYCCPSGYSNKIINGKAYCVNSGYSFDDSANCVKYEVEGTLTYDISDTTKSDDLVCPNVLGEGWVKQECIATGGGGNASGTSVSYKCSCKNVNASICTISPSTPTYSENVCFNTGDGYVWSKTSNSASWLKTSIDSETECQNANVLYEESTKACFEKTDTTTGRKNYTWDKKDNSSLTSAGWSINTIFTTKDDCLSKNVYDIKYEAPGAENVPKSQIKYGLQEFNLSSAKPTKEGSEFSHWISGDKIYNPGDTYNEDANLTLTAVWVSTNWLKNTEKYSYDKNTKFMSSISVETEVSEFNKNVVLNDGYSIKVIDPKTYKGKSILYTGCEIQILNSEGNIYETIKGVVLGDVNGTGTIDSQDYAEIYNDFIETKLLSGIEKMAADYNKNGKIDSQDYAEIYNYFKGVE